MEYKVRDIIETLKRIPDPKYAGQIKRFAVLSRVEDLRRGDDKNTTVAKIITLKAERFVLRGHEWLEWMIDIKE